MAQSDTLKPAQLRAVAALLVERDVRAAAKAAGVSERALWRWMDLPDFQRELKQAEARAVDAAVRRLADLTGEAVDTLRAVMADTEAPAGSRVTAANAALSRLMDLKQLNDLEGRLAAVEARLLAQEQR